MLGTDSLDAGVCLQLRGDGISNMGQMYGGPAGAGGPGDKWDQGDQGAHLEVSFHTSLTCVDSCL